MSLCLVAGLLAIAFSVGYAYGKYEGDDYE